MIHRPAARLVLVLAALLLAAPAAHAVSFTVKNCSNVFTSFYAFAENTTEDIPQNVTSWQSLAHGESGTMACPTGKCRMQIMPHTGLGTRRWWEGLVGENRCFLQLSPDQYNFYLGGDRCGPPYC